MSCKNPSHCSLDCKICIYSDLEHFKELMKEVEAEIEWKEKRKKS